MDLDPVALFAASPLHRWLDCKIIRMDGTAAVLELPFREEFVGDPEQRTYHGGIIACLVDAAGSFCVIATAGRDCVTVDVRLDYLRPAGPTTLRALAAPTKVGGRIAVADVEVSNEGGDTVALGRLTLALVPDRLPSHPAAARMRTEREEAPAGADNAPGASRHE